MSRECPGPAVAGGRRCARCHLVTAFPPDGRLSQSEQQVAPIRVLVTARLRHRLFCQQNQEVAPSRHLVTQNRRAAPGANTPDGATATSEPERHARGRGSNSGCPAWRASAPDWRPCWRRGRQPLNSKSGDDGCAGQGEITYDSTCTCGAPYSPSRPLRRGRIIRKRNGPPVSIRQTTDELFLLPYADQTAIPAAPQIMNFNPPVLAEIQTGADKVPPTGRTSSPQTTRPLDRNLPASLPSCAAP